MKQTPTVAIVVALAFAVALWAYFRFRTEPGPPPPPIVEAAYVVEGEMGNDGPALVEKLAKQVPGVVDARFDYVTDKLSLRVLRRVFDERSLAEVLTRPGLGWSLKPAATAAAAAD